MCVWSLIPCYSTGLLWARWQLFHMGLTSMSRHARHLQKGAPVCTPSRFTHTHSRCHIPDPATERSHQQLDFNFLTHTHTHIHTHFDVGPEIPAPLPCSPNLSSTPRSVCTLYPLLLPLPPLFLLVQHPGHSLFSQHNLFLQRDKLPTPFSYCRPGQPSHVWLIMNSTIFV